MLFVQADILKAVQGGQAGRGVAAAGAGGGQTTVRDADLAALHAKVDSLEQKMDAKMDAILAKLV